MGLFTRNKAPRDGSAVSHSALDAPLNAPLAATGTYDTAPRAADMTVGQYANGIPNMKLGAMIRSLLKQSLWVIPLFALGAIPAWMFSQDFKRTYTGEGTVMVQIGDEYVYQPVIGSAGQSSLMQTPDTITLNEIAIIKSPEVMDAVLWDVICGEGEFKSYVPRAYPRFNEDIAAKLRDRPCQTVQEDFEARAALSQRLAYMELRKQMDKQFYVAARPKSSIIDMSYKHEDPQLAKDVLNALLDEYMAYRRSVFVDGATDAAADRRRQTEEQLAAVDRQISAFLARNRISDFDSEQAGASKRTEDLKAALNLERATIAETERALAVVEDQLRGVPESINLYVDDRASNRIAQAELELQQLLAKYLPTSDPVRQKRVEIEELRALQRANGGQAVGGRRVGPNPVHQELLTRRNTLAATANAAREKEFTLQRQLDSVDNKLARMTALSPRYNDLLRERDALSARLTSYLNKEQEALINQEQAMAAAENVKVVSEATYPVKGRNMQMLVFAMAMLAWGFTLFMLALFRVFADPRLYATPPGARTALREPEAEPVLHDPIPEPVQPYAPATPMPAEYAPAAYAEPAPAYVPGGEATAYVPDAAAQNWQTQEWQAQEWAATADGYAPAADYAATDPYAQAQAAPYAPAVPQQQPHAAPHVMDNPYLSGASAAPLAPPA